MTPIILEIQHIKQRQMGDCLAACAAMVLTHLGLSVSYDHLLELLEVSWFGTASSNIRTLRKLELIVVFKQGDLKELHAHLSNNRPCITFVQTGELPYWNENIAHAVVVSGLDEKYIYLNDPVVDSSPIQVPHGDFDLAWLEWDELYATFTPKQSG